MADQPSTMSGVDGVSGTRSSPWEDAYEKPLPKEAEKAAANIANAPWLADATGGTAASGAAYPAAIFSNPAMYGAPVRPAPPPPASPPRPAPLAVAPNAMHGVALANLAEHVPAGTRTDASRAFTCGAGYKLYPEVSKQPDGTDALVYWKAFNTETKRVEFLVGSDTLKTFTSAPSDYATAAANAFMGEQDAATRESARVVDLAVRKGFGPAIEHLGTASAAAWTDPKWVIKTTANVVSAVGPSAAVAADVRLQVRTAAAERAFAEPSATAFVAHVSNDVPLGKLPGTRTMNCANCAIATDASIAGSPATALPGDVTKVSDLAEYYEKPWSAWIRTPNDLEAAMAAEPAGARGIVFARNPRAGVGHFFNVVNEDGRVMFVDGQTGGAASLRGYDKFLLLRTK